MKTNLLIIIILLASLAVNVLLLTKYKFGDKRDSEIFNYTSIHTLFAFTIYLVIDIIFSLISKKSTPDSFTNLFIISFLFLVNQLMYRKKIK
ncbi:histidine kinase [Anaerococcus vaginalis]|uniref:histidine kinase n=1 Tax=Anaerococcus vaginalis TaxID=33037 RepID=UPI002900B743|nr:histidine kinase [Anaerococcus vaginalis]MDU2374638.1 histidine kinase [Anaerococcus vaginalis]